MLPGAPVLHPKGPESGILRAGNNVFGIRFTEMPVTEMSSDRRCKPRGSKSRSHAAHIAR